MTILLAAVLAVSEPVCPMPGEWEVGTEIADWSGARVSELDAATLPAAAKVD